MHWNSQFWWRHVRPPCMCGAHTTFSCINYVTISRHRLTCTCTPLWDFSVRVRASPYGFLTVSKTSEALWGLHAVSQTSEALWVFLPFRGEWRHLGFSVRLAAMDTFWVLCLTVWVFIYLFIYLLLYLNIYLFVYLFIFMF